MVIIYKAMRIVVGHDSCLSMRTSGTAKLDGTFVIKPHVIDLLKSKSHSPVY